MQDDPQLKADEKLVWEGKPDTKLRFGMETLATGIFAGALILACLGLATVIDRSDPGTYWAILAPGLIVGALIVLVLPVLDSAKRKRTTYQLTNMRAVIHGPRHGGTYPIPPIDQLIYRNGTPPTIYFARQPIAGKRGQFHDIGFERITQAKDVFITMRDLSKDVHG